MTEQQAQVTRITTDAIAANIVSEYYFTAENGLRGAEAASNLPSAVYEPSIKLLTFCVLVLENGFTVTGEAACVSPANFNAEIGKQIARQNAVEKIWPLMGYELRSKLSKAR